MMEELQVVSPSDGEEKTLVDGLPRDRRNTHMGSTLLEVQKVQQISVLSILVLSLSHGLKKPKGNKHMSELDFIPLLKYLTRRVLV